MGRRIKIFTAAAAAGILLVFTLTLLISCENGMLDNILKSIELPLYTLTLTDDGNGSTNPSGKVVLQKGVPTEISALPDSGYRFDEWTEISGTGIDFANIISADTTVTLNTGDATIRANFAEEDTPEINLEYNSSGIPSGSAIELGDAKIGEAADLVFTIENTGDAALTGISVSRDSGSPSFTIQADPPSSINAGDSKTFTLRCFPVAYGDISAVFHISSNDADENPYIITLNAAGHYQGVKSIYSTGNVGKGSSIVVNDQTVYVSYYDESNGNLRLARSTDGGFTWENRTIDSGGDVGLHTSIARAWDPSDEYVITICYYDATNGNLKLARATESENAFSTWSWTVSAIRNTAHDEGKYCCISENGQRISYINSTTNRGCYCDSDGNAAYNTGTGMSLDLCDTFASSDAGTAVSYSDDSFVYSTFFNAYNSGTGGGDFTYFHEKYMLNYFSRIPDSSTGNYPNSWPSICSNGSYVYITYFYTYHGPMMSDLNFVSSGNNGSTFGSPISIKSSMSTEYEFNTTAFSDLTYEGGKLYCTFSGWFSGSPGSYNYQNLNFCSSSDNGVSWTPVQTIDVGGDGTQADLGLYCSIDASGSDGEYVFISYYDDAAGDLMFAKSIDGGATWD